MKHDEKRMEVILKAKAREIRKGLADWDAIAVESSAEDMERIHLAQQRDIAVSHADRDTRLLRDVEAALGRLKNGRYGLCEDCDEVIALKRLHALPWASRCRACQEHRDGAAANFGQEFQLFAA